MPSSRGSWADCGAAAARVVPVFVPAPFVVPAGSAASVEPSAVFAARAGASFGALMAQTYLRLELGRPAPSLHRDWCCHLSLMHGHLVARPRWSLRTAAGDRVRHHPPAGE